MPTFVYTARNPDGTIQKGHLEAPSEEDVISSLQHRGLLITSIGRGDVAAEKKDIKFKKSKSGRGGRLGPGGEPAAADRHGRGPPRRGRRPHVQGLARLAPDDLQ
jgi:hypothetical protein